MALWSPSKKLKFAIRSFYKVLAIQERREKRETTFLREVFGGLWVPHKAAAFVWTASLGKILAIDNHKGTLDHCGDLMLYV